LLSGEVFECVGKDLTIKIEPNQCMMLTTNEFEPVASYV
jgi:alpha-amylase